MDIKQAKIYYDGGHYIATDASKYPKKKALPKPHIITEEQKQFDMAYAATNALHKREQKEKLDEAMTELIPDKAKRNEFIFQNLERQKRNEIIRKCRLYRKLYLQEWNFFCTFTYDDNKHTEESFRKGLSTCLSHLVSRKGWKHIGVWERSPENQRLHYHGIFFIPQMIGELIEVKDYSTKKHRMQISIQNTHFNEKFGRSDFKAIKSQADIVHEAKYILKYIRKTGERIVYSRGLPTYFKSDIMDEDIVCYRDEYGRRAILFDDFTCINDGEIIGKVSREVIAKMPKAN